MVLAALAVLACAAPLAQAAVAPPPSDLFVVRAAHGSLTPLKGADRYLLELRDVDRQTTWFTDRPERAAGTHSTASFFAGWTGLGFTSDPPNAAIALTGGQKNADTLVVKFGRPRYDAKARTLRMKVRRLGTDAKVRSGHERRADRRLPRRFGAVSLFVDGAPSLFTVRLVNTTRSLAYISEIIEPGGTSVVTYDHGWVAPLRPGTSIDYSVPMPSSTAKLRFGSVMLLPLFGQSVTLKWTALPDTVVCASKDAEERDDIVTSQIPPMCIVTV